MEKRPRTTGITKTTATEKEISFQLQKEQSTFGRSTFHLCETMKLEGNIAHVHWLICDLLYMNLYACGRRLITIYVCATADVCVWTMQQNRIVKTKHENTC